MKYLKIYITIIFLLILSIYSFSQQREFFMEDIDADNQIVLEINSDTTNMKVGVDLIGGWIKMINNSPLWFGTNNTPRVTINNSGDVGINTSEPKAKLHVNQGDIRLESIESTSALSTSYNSGIDFYKGSAPTDYLGGVSYSNPGFALGNIATNLISNAGLLSFATDNFTRLSVNPSGEVSIAGFPSNQGNSNVMATADGTLTTTIKETLIINPSDLNFNRNPSIGLYSYIKALGNENQFGVTVQAFLPLDLPVGTKITRADIYYIDDSVENLRVRFRRTQNNTDTSTNTTIFTSSGSPSSSTSDIEFATVNTNWTIGDDTIEKSHLFIELNDEALGISSVILTYEY